MGYMWPGTEEASQPRIPAQIARNLRDNRTDDVLYALLSTLAVLTAIAASIHLFCVPEHMMEYGAGEIAGYIPLAFLASAIIGYALLPALTFVEVTPFVGGAFLAFNGIMLGAGAWSRLFGLPGAKVEPITAPWVVAMLAELFSVAIVLVLLVKYGERTRYAPEPRTSIILLGVLASLLLAFVLVGPDTWDHAQMLAGWLWLLPKGWLW